MRAIDQACHLLTLHPNLSLPELANRVHVIYFVYGRLRIPHRGAVADGGDPRACTTPLIEGCLGDHRPKVDLK